MIISMLYSASSSLLAISGYVIVIFQLKNVMDAWVLFIV